MFNKRKLTRAFTIIEIMVSISIFSIVLLSGFKAYFAILGSKIKIIEQTSIQKNSFYFSEKIFEMIKKGGNIDYEEYFNRKVIGSSYSSGHYSLATGFGNFGDNGILGTTTYGNGYYYCVSGNGIGNKVGTGGCYDSTFNSLSSNVNNRPQRYGEYSLQFIDYNSDYNSDAGDHDFNGNIRGDDDDEFLGEGPSVFTGGVDVKELYLISSNKKNRIFFRWNVKQDVNHPTYPSSSCDFTNPSSPTGSGCLGTIEFLKLDGKDWGLDHINLTADITEADGVIDTWIINDDFSASPNTIAGTDNNNYWIPLFPGDVNVKDFKLFLYPNEDRLNSFKNTSNDINISPYIRLHMALTPSWKKRGQIKGKAPEIPLNVTISLNDSF